jgi:type VI secretion system ImpC/EvpB family protein
VPDRSRHHRPPRKELSDLGFIPLVHCKNTDYAAFFGAQSAQKAKKYDTDAANANASLSAQLQYMFAVSRIAHYMKAMMRDKIGSFARPPMSRAYLQRWIDKFVTTDDSASQETKAEFRCARRRSRSAKCRAGRACIAQCPSSARISSSTSCRCRCASWPNCRNPAKANRFP